MSITEVHTPSSFEASLSDALASSPDGRVFVHLYASVDEKTGKSWCPDCVTSIPLVNTHAEKTNITLLNVPVGDRPTWRDLQNFYRVHPLITATRVPTLVEWTKSGPVGRLVEDEVNRVDTLEKFIAK